MTKTKGAIKAGGGRYTFDLAKLNTIDAGPGYSTAHGQGTAGPGMEGTGCRYPPGSLIRRMSRARNAARWASVKSASAKAARGSALKRARNSRSFFNR